MWVDQVDHLEDGLLVVSACSGVLVDLGSDLLALAARSGAPDDDADPQPSIGHPVWRLGLGRRHGSSTGFLG